MLATWDTVVLHGGELVGSIAGVGEFTVAGLDVAGVLSITPGDRQIESKIETKLWNVSLVGHNFSDVVGARTGRVHGPGVDAVAAVLAVLAVDAAVVCGLDLDDLAGVAADGGGVVLTDADN